MESRRDFLKKAACAAVILYMIIRCLAKKVKQYTNI